MRYIYAPLDLTTEEREIYFLLYSRMDFDTFQVKYTLEQLVVDSNSKLELTKRKVNRIVKKFISENFISVIKKGSKGNATLYQVTKIKEIYGTQREVKGTQREVKSNLKPSDINNQGDTMEHKRNLKEHKRNLNVTPINDKEIDKDKDNIYTTEKEIFDYWNNKKGVIKSREGSFNKNKTKISTAIKNYKKENILKAIDRLDKAVLDTNYYYTFKWNLFKFLKQNNGIPNWLDDGQFWNDYIQKGVNNGRIKQNNAANQNTKEEYDFSKYEG